MAASSDAGIACGGAIFLAAELSVTTPPSVLTMTNSTLSSNQAIGGSSDGTGFITEGGIAQGGGITVSHGSIVTIDRLVFTNNEAIGGGGGGGGSGIRRACHFLG